MDFMKSKMFILFIMNLAFAINLFSQTTINALKPINQKVPLISVGNFAAETFIAPDNSFQIALPTHNYKSILELESSELKVNGTGMRYSWSSDNFQLSVKAVFSEDFYVNKSIGGRKKFWKENIKQIKSYAIQQVRLRRIKTKIYRKRFSG
jgi:hypothetical protein